MKVALLGNPNTGKSSIFNALTGMRQQTGNYPGITVEVKTGFLNKKKSSDRIKIIDFPGTYSIYPRSIDEQIVYSSLTDKSNENHPDLAIIVCDSTNLDRNLFLFSQVYDLQIPVILVLNMADLAHKKGIIIDKELLLKEFPGIAIVETNARVNLGIERLKSEISNFKFQESKPNQDFKLCSISDDNCQSEQAEIRHQRIHKVTEKLVTDIQTDIYRSNKIDKIITDPVWGYLIFATILLLIFQSIFSFAAYPMDWIDDGMLKLSEGIRTWLSPGIFIDLLTEGILPGIAGVLIFIPQIALLFFFISILEESGYLARVVFIMDRIMRPLGLSGKSVVPLMSSVACAIPGVMSARVISDWKERLTTIMVAPLMSCSARIPVYTLLIALVIPKTYLFGFMNLQGLVLFALYFLGLIGALVVAYIFKLLIKAKSKSFMIMELPSYKIPRLQNIGLSVFDKVKMFVWGAGKIILAISIILWAMAKYGPGDRVENAIVKISKAENFKTLSQQEKDQKLNAIKLENSYIGIIGKTIEPVIKPLGYDWKIGIALITSFAAREVFVGSLSTIYSVHDEGDENKRLADRMKLEKRADGTLVFNLATGLSLMVFYVFAMQCMATVAVVKRETNSWRWPLIQMAYMGVLAYFGALVTYLIFK